MRLSLWMSLEDGFEISIHFYFLHCLVDCAILIRHLLFMLEL